MHAAAAANTEERPVYQQMEITRQAPVDESASIEIEHVKRVMNKWNLRGVRQPLHQVSPH